MYSTQLKKPAVYDCPETGLETVRYPAWPEDAADAPFALEVRVIAGRIIHIQSSGTPSLAAMRRGFSFINRVRLAHIPEGISFAVIEDMSQIGGISIEARKEYIHAIRSVPWIKGVILYNANAMQKFMVRLAKLGQKFPFPLLVSHHYAHAIELAWSVLGESAAAGDPAVSAARGRLPKMFRLQPEGPTVLTHPEWRLERDTFQTDFKVIDGNILYSISSGELTADVVSEIATLREKVMLEALAGTHFQYIVADTTRLAGGGWRARQEYLHSLKQWHSLFPFTAYIVFGSNRFMRIAVRLAGLALPFKMVLTESLDSALAEIRRMSASGPLAGDAPQSASPLSGTSPESDVGSYVEELLNSLAGFTWNVPDPVDVAPCP